MFAGPLITPEPDHEEPMPNPTPAPKPDPAPTPTPALDHTRELIDALTLTATALEQRATEIDGQVSALTTEAVALRMMADGCHKAISAAG